MAFTDYITNTFGQVKTQLAWTDSGQLATIIAKALQLYGVDTEAEATDSEKAERLVDYCVWRQALADISLDYSFSADDRTLHRSQAVDHIRSNANEAYRLALGYMPEYQIIIHEDTANSDWWETSDADSI